MNLEVLDSPRHSKLCLSLCLALVLRTLLSLLLAMLLIGIYLNQSSRVHEMAPSTRAKRRQ